jgi:hypothetical protein
MGKDLESDVLILSLPFYGIEPVVLKRMRLWQSGGNAILLEIRNGRITLRSDNEELKLVELQKTVRIRKSGLHRGTSVSFETQPPLG